MGAHQPLACRARPSNSTLTPHISPRLAGTMLALLLNAGAASAFVGPAFSMVRRSSAHRAAPAAMMGPERITVDANGDIADGGFEITKSTTELPSSTPPLKPPLTLNIDRTAEALVYQPAEGTPKGGVV